MFSGCISKMEKKLATSWENQQSSYAKTKTQISFAMTAKLISAFVFDTRIVHFLFFLNLKSQASSHVLCLCSSACVRPVRKPNCLISHEAARMLVRYLANAFSNCPSELEILWNYGNIRSSATNATLFEPPHRKTNNQHMRKQRRRSASR